MKCDPIVDKFDEAVKTVAMENGASSTEVLSYCVATLVSNMLIGGATPKDFFHLQKMLYEQFKEKHDKLLQFAKDLGYSSTKDLSFDEMNDFAVKEGWEASK